MSNSIRIRARPSSSYLTASTFDDFLMELRRRVYPRAIITIDLCAVQFIDLFAMVGLIYSCADLHDQGCRICLEVDTTSRGACGFLPRIGFFQVLDEYVEVQDTSLAGSLSQISPLYGRNKDILELTPFTTNNEIKQLLNQIQDVLRWRMLYNLDDTYDFAILISELCHNILEHNPPGTVGLAAMQVYPFGRNGSFGQLVVADRGLGIGATLGRNQKFSGIRSDTRAIVLSTELGVSEHGDTTRGTGLHHLLRLAQKHKATLHIRSQTGKVHVRGDQDKLQEFTVPHLTGSQFSIALPAFGR